MRKNILSILMPMVILGPLAIDIYLPSMPIMATEFNITANQVQSTIVLFIFALGAGQILIGPLADRYGRRPIAIAGISLYIISSFIAVIAKDFSWLQTARVLQGIAACSSSIVVFSAVRDSFSPKEGARYYSYLNGMICIIPALAPTLGGLLALQFGWRSTFLVMALYAIIVLLLVIFRLPETKPTSTDSSGSLYHWARFKPVLQDPHFLFYAITCMAGMAAILTYVSYAPTWLINHIGVSEITFSLLFGLNAAINIIACFVAPFVMKKFGNRPTVIIALFCLFLSALSLYVTQEYGINTGLMAAFNFMLPMMILCIGFALLLGPATSMALSSFGERAGTATAMLGCIQMSGAALLSGLVQKIGLSGPDSIILLVGIVAVSLLAIMFMSRFNHWHLEQLES